MTFDEQHDEVNKQILSLNPGDISPLKTYKVEPIYTLISKPPEDVIKQISDLAEALKNLSPEHYYYPPGQYHCTLMPLSTSEDVVQANNNDIRDLISGNPIKVCVVGVAANKHSVAITLYPQGNSFVKLRDKIRELFGTVLDYSEHNQIWEQLMWVHILRFTKTPSEEFLKAVYEFRNKIIGEYEIKGWDLYKTSSKVLAPEDSELVEHFKA